jgi:hypothetical protein
MPAITLTHPTAGPGATPLALTLPADLIWSDEFAFKQIQQAREYTTTGALIVEEWRRQTGRPITLQGDVTYGWCQRGTLQTLSSWASQPGLLLSLVRNGTTHSVGWDHEAGAVEATPIVPYADPEPVDQYTLTLRFLEL